MCSVVSCGTQNLIFGPIGGLKGASGAMPGLPFLNLRDNTELTDRQRRAGCKDPIIVESVSRDFRSDKSSLLDLM
jgi:hypothetical protein